MIVANLSKENMMTERTETRGQIEKKSESVDGELNADTVDIPGFIKPFRVKPGSKKVKLADFDAGYKGEGLKKKKAVPILEQGIDLLFSYQDRLYAENTDALLVILQARMPRGRIAPSSTSCAA